MAGYVAGFPDLFFYEARHGFHGLALELKAPGGRASKSQLDWMESLILKGYRARIVKGWDETIAALAEYFDDTNWNT